MNIKLKTIKYKIIVGLISSILCISPNCTRRGQGSSKKSMNNISTQDFVMGFILHGITPTGYLLELCITNTSNQEMQLDDLEFEYDKLQSSHQICYFIYDHKNPLPLEHGKSINIIHLTGKQKINKDNIIVLSMLIHIKTKDCSTDQKIKFIVRNKRNEQCSAVECELPAYKT